MKGGEVMKRFIFFLVLLLLIIIPAFILLGKQGQDQSNGKDSGCINCHGNKELMTKLGYPQLYLDPKKVDEEVNMAGVPTCVDCHLGNPNTMDKEEAHKGMPRPFYAAVGKEHKYSAIGRFVTNYDPILPQGNDRTKYLIRKALDNYTKEYGLRNLFQLFFHDHDPKTMAYSPQIALQTCGKCHSEETEKYNKSNMGLNKHQRAYRNFIDTPPGPHNCGAWFLDNYEEIKRTTYGNFTKIMNDATGRGCNACHASCNDCHYQGFKKSEARHVFVKKPDIISCMGSGRATICHAGPMDRRRGAGYVREEFAYPLNEMEPDVHYKKNIHCIECHTNISFHEGVHLASDVARNSCRKCHKEIVEAINNSYHKNVDCASCHIQKVGAYQFTFWGPGLDVGVQTLLKKHKEFYGIRDLPTLIKHPATGRWIPVKPYPMGILNVVIENKTLPFGKLIPRIIPEREIKGNTAIGEPSIIKISRSAKFTNDFLILTKFITKLPNNENMLAWIQMDKMSHGLGKARNCESCHNSHEQISFSWYYYDTPSDVKKPFYGAYRIIASKNGIIFDFFNNTEIIPVEGRRIDDFAPFIFFPEAWNVKGVDLSIPFNEKLVVQENILYKKIYAEINYLMSKEKNEERISKLKLIRAILPHNREYAMKLLNEFKK